MRLPQLTVLNLELFDQTMATHAATSIFIRILVHLFLHKSVMQEEQPVLCKNMQDCGSNLMRFCLLLRVWPVELRSAHIGRTKKKDVAEENKMDGSSSVKFAYVYGRGPDQGTQFFITLERIEKSES